jgi:hypothetical protein
MPFEKIPKILRAAGLFCPFFPAPKVQRWLPLLAVQSLCCSPSKNQVYKEKKEKAKGKAILLDMC